MAEIQYRLTWRGLERLKKMTNVGEIPWLFVHVPVRPKGLAFRNMKRLFFNDFAGPAYRYLTRRHQGPIVGMDFNDEAELSPHRSGDPRSMPRLLQTRMDQRSESDAPKSSSPRLRDMFDRNVHKLRPISVGLCAERQANLPTSFEDKTHDVFYAGTPSSALRIAEYPLLDELRRRGWSVDVPTERLTQAEFFRRCQRSRLVWSPEGRGWDCFRHYEAASVGSVPVINALGFDLIGHWFTVSTHFTTKAIMYLCGRNSAATA